MRVKGIKLVKRFNGFFELDDGRRIPAVHRGNGYGVVVVLEPSKLDVDFGLPEIAFRILREFGAVFYLFLEADQLEELQHKFKESDELTHRLLGHGWSGKRPFWKLEDFM